MHLVLCNSKPMASPNSVVVNICGAARTRGTVEVLSPVTTSVRGGQALAVTGPNGSGKSTLLRMIAGLDQPSSGTIELLGVPAATARRTKRAQLAVLIDGLSAYPDLTVAEHFELVASAWGQRHFLGDRPAPAVDTALADAGLTRVADQYPGELSSGEAQMFALACTLYRPGAVVIVDEPEQRLDGHWRALSRSLLADALDAGRTVVVATHDAELRNMLARSGASDGPRGLELALTRPDTR